MAKLTDKQKKFCEEYLVDLNATQAAIRSGYSTKTAAAQAARLLINVNVQKEVQELKDRRALRTEITADFVLKELAAIATTKITDIVNVHNRPIEMDDGTVISVPYVEIKNTEELTEAQKASIASIKQTKHGVEIKMHDKVSTLKLIGDHLGMFAPVRDASEELEDDGFIDALREGAKVWDEE